LLCVGGAAILGRMSMSRIAVLRPGALGDAVLTLPVLASLSAAGAAVTVAGHALFALAVECGLAAARIAFDDARLLGLFAEGGSCGLFTGFDLAIAYGSADSSVAASLRRSGVRRVVQWPSHPPSGTHVVAHLLGALEAAGLGTACRAPSLPPRPAWLDAARAWLGSQGLGGRFAAIHPGSGGRAKRWPVERFAALAQGLAVPTVWLLGPAEEGDAEAHDVGRRLGVVAQGLPLATLAGLLASCSAYVGNDSGVTHLAAAVGAPTVALFGPTEPAVWAPLGAHVKALGGPKAGGFAPVPVEAAADAVRLALALKHPR